VGRQPLPTDTILGNGSDQYRIDTVLGPGGFGVTYLARDMRFDRDVAIKEYFPAEFAYRDGSTTIRSSTRGGQQDFFDKGKRYFLDEARTLAKFRHEHIVRVINLFEQFNTAYMVLEFEEGQSLKAWLRAIGRRPTQSELDNILEPLLAALDVVHAKGMFHRDIAPDNVIIRPSGKPVLIDFGAARHLVREHSHTIGAIVKHGYSPPEQYTLDTKLQGAWSDIYSLSATIYAAMTGQPPEEAAKRQLHDGVLPLEETLEPAVLDAYRPAFVKAIGAGLRLRPRDRPQNIAAFRAILHGEVDVEPLFVPPVRNGHARPAKPAVSTPPSGPASQSAHLSARLTPSGDVSAARPSSGPSLVSVASRASSAVAGPAEVSSAAIQPTVTEESTYPEQPARIASGVALAVAATAAVTFLAVGGIEHPGGLAAAMLACAGLVGAGLERTMAVTRARSRDGHDVAVAAAAMSSLALAIYWLPLFLWPMTILMGGMAVMFVLVKFGRWVPITLLGLALVHLGIAALLLVLATRSQQKDPVFLPMMGITLAFLAGLAMTAALSIQKRWEQVRT